MSVLTPDVAIAQSIGRPDRRRMALLALCAAQFLVVLDVAIVNVALPSISTALHLSGAALAWVVNAYVLALAGLLLVGGRLADQFGRRRIFLAGLVIFGVASLGCGLATAPSVLVAARAVQGVGAALAAPSALALIADLYPSGQERTRALGVWALIGASGGAFGVLLGGVITSSLGWRWIFDINVPLCAAAIALARRSIESAPPATSRRLQCGAVRREITAVMLVTSGLTLLILAVMTAPGYGWSSARTVLTLAGGAFALALFAAEERRSRHPLLPVGLLSDRVTGSMTVVTMLATGAGFGMLFLLSLYMHQVLGFSALRAGLGYLTLVLPLSCAALVAGRLNSRIGPGRVLTAGLVLSVAGRLLLSAVPVPGDYLSDLVPGLFLSGLGIGCTTAPVTVLMVGAAKRESAGVVTAWLSASQQLGGALGVAAVIAVTSGGPLSASRYDAGFTVTAGFAAAALALTLATARPARGSIAAAGRRSIGRRARRC